MSSPRDDEHSALTDEEVKLLSSQPGPTLHKITSPEARVSHGDRLRQRLKDPEKTKATLPFVGVFDVFSASLAAKKWEAVFCSGYCFSASYYGLPDAGFITWSDMADWVARLRLLLPDTHIAVDIDDGYGHDKLVEMVIRRMELSGASAVILEDQRRPKKCGHLPGKEVVPIDEYVKKLKAALRARESLFIVARTDASTLEEGIRRVTTYAKLGVDCVMVEGITDLAHIGVIRAAVPAGVHVLVNMVEGGRTPTVTMHELAKLGAQLALFSMPMLFAAHAAMEYALNRLIETDGRTTKPDEKELVSSVCPSCKQNSITLAENNTVLTTNQFTLFPNTAELRRRSVEFADPQARLDSVISSFKPGYLQTVPYETTDLKETKVETVKETTTKKEQPQEKGKEKPASPPAKEEEASKKASKKKKKSKAKGAK
jgi:2-methylisocitrate lyase-like PEP mutase family enzyme